MNAARAVNATCNGVVQEIEVHFTDWEFAMAKDYYRYCFEPTVPSNQIEVAFALALLSCESVHGDCQTRLDAGYGFDADTLRLVIDAGTPVGRDLNRLFVGIIKDEFGEDCFKVERLERTTAGEQKPQ